MHPGASVMSVTVPSISLWRCLSLAGPLFRRHMWIYVFNSCWMAVAYDVLLLTAGGRPFGHYTSKFNIQSAAGGSAIFMMIPIVAAINARLFPSESEALGVSHHTVRETLVAIPAVVVTQIFAYFCIGIAGIVFVVPGLILWLRLFLVGTVVGGERRVMLAALKRSWSLTANRYVSTFGVLISIWLLVLAATTIVHIVARGAGNNLLLLLEIGIQIGITMYSALVITGYYYECIDGSR
jgi:hypothetical protein